MTDTVHDVDLLPMFEEDTACDLPGCVARITKRTETDCDCHNRYLLCTNHAQMYLDHFTEVQLSNFKNGFYFVICAECKGRINRLNVYPIGGLL